MARLTPIGIVLKWVAVPAALACIGYFMVGPRVGKDVLAKANVPESIKSILNGSEDSKIASGGTSPTVDVVPASAGPSVDVSVSRVVSLDPEPEREKPRRKVRRSKPEPKVEKPKTENVPPLDDPIKEFPETVPPISTPPADGGIDEIRDGATTGGGTGDDSDSEEASGVVGR